MSRLRTAHGNPVTEMSSISFLKTRNSPFPAASGGSAILAGSDMLLAEFQNGVLPAGRFTLACEQACRFVSRFSAVPPFTALCLWCTTADLVLDDFTPACSTTGASAAPLTDFKVLPAELLVTEMFSVTVLFLLLGGF